MSASRGEKRKSVYSPESKDEIPPNRSKKKMENLEVGALNENNNDDTDELDVREGLRTLINLQTESNNKMNKILERLDRVYKWVENLDEALVSLEERIVRLEQQKSSEKSGGDLAALRTENNALQKKITDLEDRSRRNNITISGISDNHQGNEQWEETEKIVLEICESKLGLKNIEIERAHRIGRRNERKPRLIICKLLNFKDKNRIMQNAHKLKNTGIFINEDYSPRTRTARFHLRGLARQKRTEGEERIKLRFDRLWVGQKCFMYDFDKGEVIEVSHAQANPLV